MNRFLADLTGALNAFLGLFLILVSAMRILPSSSLLPLCRFTCGLRVLSRAGGHVSMVRHPPDPWPLGGTEICPPT